MLSATSRAMKCPVGWGPALLAALLVQHLHLGGAVNSHRKQPAIGAVGKLRAVIETRTEELTEQKNIAHGLELTVRELQAELLNEKKALATETQKEHTLQQKLNRVQAVLSDKKEEKGSPVLAALPAAAAMSAVSEAPASVDAFHVKTLAPLPPLPPLEEAVEAFPNVADAGLEPAEEPAPTAARRQAPQTPQAVAFEEPAQVAHSHQTTAQEPPPFFEALPAVQSSTMTLPAKHEVKAPKIQARRFASGAHNAAPVQHKAKVAKMRSPPKAYSQPTKAKHMRGLAKQVVAAPKPMAVAPAAATPQATNTAANADSGADTGFDALEAQLHEEDRRIQDLDRENALDAMSDGGLPPAPGSTPQAPVKPMPAQQKMELDTEAPMDDFLNVGAPGLDSASEVAPLASADTALALPQLGETMSTGLDAALSDNQFLAQIAPGPRH